MSGKRSVLYRTRYIGATDTLPARIAVTGEGHRTTIGYERTQPDPFRDALEFVVGKLYGIEVVRALPRGYVWRVTF